MSLISQYESRLVAEGLSSDPDQLRVLDARRVKLVLSAGAPAPRLYIGERLAFEFQRMVSRLTEMQTPAFLGRAHLG